MEIDDDNSNDVVLIEDNDEEETAIPPVAKNDNRPLMRLFDRLISNDDKQNTVLTNAQIISILEVELGMDINKLHDIEIDIYLMVVKTFLKHWPQWDEFDRVINRFKKINANKSIPSILEHKYRNLKQYLRSLIEKAGKLAAETVRKVENDKGNLSESELKDIVLEIYCTRKQLNQLIYDKPHTDLNNTIFNLVENDSQVSLRTVPIEAILNWTGVRLTIDFGFFFYTRSTMHKLDHVLVNKQNIVREEKVINNTNIQIKDSKLPTEMISVVRINEMLNNVLQCSLQEQDKVIMNSIFNVIRSDLSSLTLSELMAPGAYRHCPNKYQYQRKLSEHLDGAENKNYNLYIQETITPIYMFHIGKFGTFNIKSLPPALMGIKIECSECKTKFSGVDLRFNFSEHFHVYHNNEKDWYCVNCKKVFPMHDLAQKCWRHEC